MGKKLRLLFPQWQGGTGPDYSLGARLLAVLAPEDHETPLMEVPVDPFGSYELKLEKGMFARSALIRQLEAAASIIQAYRPDQLITFGGDCLVDQAPIDYLNGRYGGDYGVLWVDAHPDISNTDIFPNGNSMLVGSLMGKGDAEFAAHVRNRMTPEQLLRMCIKASYSPCTSLIKCSVPLGRLRMAERLMISVNADCSVGNCLDSRRRYLKSCGLRSNATMKHLPIWLVKLINNVKRLSVCAAFVSILRQRLNCRLNGLVNRFS